MINTTYVCNKDFPNLGLEKGDIFPAYRFTPQAIEEAFKKNTIIIEQEREEKKKDTYDDRFHIRLGEIVLKIGEKNITKNDYFEAGKLAHQDIMSYINQF